MFSVFQPSNSSSGKLKWNQDENEIRQIQSSIKPVKEKTDSIPVKLDEVLPFSAIFLYFQ